jgi:hypothetical protein
MLEKRKMIGIEYLSFALVEYRNEILQIFVLEEERHYFISILD